MEKAPLRHAWLIIAHGNFAILEHQLRFLDSENADFFIHIDAKVKDFDFDRFRAIPKRSRVTFVDRIRVSWGHHSQIRCEMILLKAAVRGHYDYYHLLSGVDVPLKTREYIEHYFDDRADMNFVHFHERKANREFTDRCRYYYPLQRWNMQRRIPRLILRRITVFLQKPFVDRTKSLGADFEIQKGANWFSITHELVLYVLSKEEWIAHTFRSTFCCDEVFLQTLVWNSPFRSTIPQEGNFVTDNRAALRYVDWEHGKPYTFTEADYETLIRAEPMYLFARKFRWDSSPNVVERLFSHFGEEGGGQST